MYHVTRDRQKSIDFLSISIIFVKIAVSFVAAILFFGLFLVSSVFAGSISATPTTRTVMAGNSAVYTISIDRSSIRSDVTLAVSMLPAGATYTFSQNPTSASSTILTIKTQLTTPPGTYNKITISATHSGGSVKPIAITLVVTAPSPHVALAISPGTRSFAYGESTSYAVAINRVNFSGPVTLSVSGLPPGTSASFSPNPASGNNSTLTVSSISSFGGKSVKDLTISGSATGLTIAPRLAILDVSCNVEWIRQWGTTADETVVGMDLDGLGNVYVVGTTGTSTGWLRKYNGTGNLQWTQTISDFSPVGPYYFPARMIEDIAVTYDGSVFVVGHAENEIGKVIRYDTTGTRTLSKYVGKPGPVPHSQYYYYINNIAVDGGGNFYVTGDLNSYEFVLEKYDGNGNLKWQTYHYNPYLAQSDLEIDNSGNAFISRNHRHNESYSLVSKSHFDAAEFPYDWVYDWETDINDGCDMNSVDLALSPTGESFVTGSESCNLNHSEVGWIAKFDVYGNIAWKVGIGGSGSDVGGSGVSVSAANQPFLFGKNASGILYLADLSQTGLVLRNRYFDTSGNDSAVAVRISGTGAIYLVGVTDRAFAGMNQGGNDVWLAKVTDEPCLVIK